MKTWMRTISGKRVDFLNPDPNQIDINDIAHHLAHICRFNGAVPEHYSVAQHSVYVSQLVGHELALAALLHDAAEAYTGDLVSPYKALLRDAPAIEENLSHAIERRFKVRIYPMDPEVKAADLSMLVMEAGSLLGVDAVKEWGLPRPARVAAPIVPWPADVAKRHFLHAFTRLRDGYYPHLLRVSSVPA